MVTLVRFAPSADTGQWRDATPALRAGDHQRPTRPLTPVTPPRSLVLSSGSRGPGRGWTRSFAFIGALGVAVLVVWALLLALLWGYAWFRLGGIDLRALDDDEQDPLGAVGASAPDDAVTVLVTMTEPRDPTRPAEPELAAPVAIVQVGGPRDHAAVLLFPVDLPVSVDEDGVESVAQVHAAGGTELLAEAIIDYTEVRLDHVVTFSVDALPRLVDVVGPIELCMPDGCREVGASQVDAGQRDEDPEVVVRTVAGAVRGVASVLEARSVVTSPIAAMRAIDVVAEEIDTDVSLRGRGLVRLAETLTTSLPISIDTVPTLRHPDTGEFVPLDEPAMVRFHHLQQGTPFEPRELTDELDAYVAGGVRVAVLNGAGVAGLAAHVEAILVAEGLRSVGTGNAPTFERDTTLVAYRPADARVETAAILLAELLGDVDLERLAQDPEFEGTPVDIVVTAGADLAREMDGQQ